MVGGNSAASERRDVKDGTLVHLSIDMMIEIVSSNHKGSAVTLWWDQGTRNTRKESGRGQKGLVTALPVR